MGRVAKWDTDLGYQLYLEGRSDGEIADACGVQIGTVKAMRLNRWRKDPDGGRDRGCGHCPPSAGKPTAPPFLAEQGSQGDGTEAVPYENEKEKEVAGMPVEIDESRDTAKMMEVIAKMTEGMGGIKAVCVGNIIQNLWNLNSIDDIRDARNILSWLEANYDFG